MAELLSDDDQFDLTFIVMSGQVKTWGKMELGTAGSMPSPHTLDFVMHGAPSIAPILVI